MEKKKKNTKLLVVTAMVAAVYMVLTLMVAPLSFGLVQVRFSEMLMLLAYIDKKYAPGLILGCFLANCFSPFGIMDIVFGTACTAAAMFCVTRFAKSLVSASLWIVFCNAFIGIELYLFGSPLWLSMGMVALGEFLSVTCCGVALFRVLERNRVLMAKLKIR
ncbi:MAG: QueT transporter family protein [Bacillota bacterium]|nr:QueT transporter family protein [Bacillota bacterium]